MDVLLDEVESLEAILMEDVAIVRNPESGFPEMIETTVFPTVGENVERQYVCVTLQVIPGPDYPDQSPTFLLRNPRGLDDRSIEAIERIVRGKLIESIGQPVVFDLIDVIREQLTASNLPTGQCVVCLYGFQDGDEFTKTVCYHYLHSYCLARHLTASKRNYDEEQMKMPAWQRVSMKPYQPVCPVCRESISDDQDPLLRSARPPIELELAPQFELTDELKLLQLKMNTLFIRQKNRGGIIDLEADDGNVISINDGEIQETITKIPDDQLTEPVNGRMGLPTRPPQPSSSNRNRSTTTPTTSKLGGPESSPDGSDDPSDRNRRSNGNRHRRGGPHYPHHRHRHPVHRSNDSETTTTTTEKSSGSGKSSSANVKSTGCTKSR